MRRDLRGYTISIGISFLLIILSLFLPYETHDTTSGGWFTSMTIDETDVITAGMEILGPPASLLLMLFITALILIKRNLATSIIGFLLTILLTTFATVGFLDFPLLNFELDIFSNKTNSELKIGYFIFYFAILLFLVTTLLNMVNVGRNRKNNNHSSEIIDDTTLDQLL